MVSLSGFNFKLKVTQVQRKQIDKLVGLAGSYRESNYRLLDASIDSDDTLDTDALLAIATFKELEFSLYALAIIHCYSILENNRALICKTIPGLKAGERKGLYKVECVTDVLKGINIKHVEIECYETMEEFRRVNNAIKHGRFGLSQSVTTRAEKRYKEKIYEAMQLKSLYLDKAKHLDAYLSDLYERVCPTHHLTKPMREATQAR